MNYFKYFLVSWIILSTFRSGECDWRVSVSRQRRMCGRWQRRLPSTLFQRRRRTPMRLPARIQTGIGKRSFLTFISFHNIKYILNWLKIKERGFPCQVLLHFKHLFTIPLFIQIYVASSSTLYKLVTLHNQFVNFFIIVSPSPNS